MRIRSYIAMLVYVLVQSVLFGVGVVILLTTSLSENAAAFFPWVVISSALLAVPVAWYIAPLLRARYLYPESPAAQRDNHKPLHTH